MRWRNFFAHFLLDPFGTINSPSIPRLKDGIHVGLMLPEFTLHIGRTLTLPCVAVYEKRSVCLSTPASSNSSLPDTPDETLTPVDDILLPWGNTTKTDVAEYILPSDMMVKENYYINYIEA